MERLVDWFISLMMQPWVSKLSGSALMSFSSLTIVLGFINNRYELRTASAFQKLQSLYSGQAMPPTPHGLFEQWPFIQVMLPETFIGFVTWFSLFVVGGMMVNFGKKIERMF